MKKDEQTVGMLDILRNGFWFYFTHNNHEIAAHASGFSGRETIYVDDSKVSTKISWRFKSGHEFELDGHKYRVEFDVVSIWKGQIACHLYIDDKRVETNEHAMAINKTKLGWKTFFIMFVAGLIFGALSAYLVKLFA
ncbi:hypothetical protein [Pseudidiomarina sp.]|uniref:hypothetical protein n=1 Tax=Pseudidiomarina sp. TaxID=2081707 RepID=UPI003A97470B